MTEEEKERIIANVNATMAMEGMPLTQENIQDAKDILDGKITSKEVVQRAIKKYKKE